MRLDSPPGQGTIRRLSLVTLLSEGKLADRTEPVKSLLSTLIGKYVPRKWLLHLHTLTRHARLAGRSSADDRFARATAPRPHNARLERGTVGALGRARVLDRLQSGEAIRANRPRTTGVPVLWHDPS
jgi:hypothetical protein